MEKQNPFADVPVATTPTGQGALVDVATQREVAEVQAAVVLAKRFPRNQIEAMDRILVACQRPTLAESALYSYSRGGTEITGPSIRLAEALAQNWQNIQFGIRELDQRNGESTVESYAWDLETNTRQSKVFQVKHIRATKKGSYALSDPRDVYEVVANQGARRLRACILGVIPGDVVEAAVNQCEETLKAKADTSPEALKRMVEAFSAYSITQTMIEKRIQRRMDTITPAQVINLRKVFNSLRDGMSVSADWFEMETVDQGEDKPKGATSLKDAITNTKRPKAPPPNKIDVLPKTDPRYIVVCPPTGPFDGQEKIRMDCITTCDQFDGCPAWLEQPDNNIPSDVMTA